MKAKCIIFMMIICLVIACTSPKDSQDSLNKGKQLLQEGKLNEAMINFVAAIGFDNNNSEAHYFLGITHSLLLQFDKAENEFKKAIELDSKHYWAHYNLGRIYWDFENVSMGKKENAIKEYKKAIGLNPKFSEARTSIGCLYYANQDYDLAIHEFEAILNEEIGNGKAHYYLAAIYYKKKEYSKAIKHYDKSKELKYIHSSRIIGGPSLGEILYPYRGKYQYGIEIE